MPIRSLATAILLLGESANLAKPWRPSSMRAYYNGRSPSFFDKKARHVPPASVLFLLQKPRRFLAQYWKKAFRYLRQEPRQRHFDAQRVLQHFNARRRSLAERAHAEAQCISLPSLLLYRDHPSKVTVGAGEALFETANSLDLPETMADYDCDGIAH